MAAQVAVNDDALMCLWCECMVLGVGNGKHIVKSIELPLPQAKTNEDTETIEEHWRVDDRFDFANVGVSRAHGNDNANFRYLVCADCERGPLGLTYDLNTFYVADSRIRHVSASATAAE